MKSNEECLIDEPILKLSWLQRLMLRCPYCKSKDLKFVEIVSSDLATNYWWDLKDCNILGWYKHKKMECLKCGRSHEAP